jgi:2-amino-4-hydroxy-6-hydroxymethyldihydropteridine diphosphokinase
VIDLDLIVHGETVIRSERLTLPHSRIAERAFVLIPLRDVAPDLLIAGIAIDEHLRRLQAEGIEPIGQF